METRVFVPIFFQCFFLLIIVVVVVMVVFVVVVVVVVDIDGSDSESVTARNYVRF